MRISVVTPAFFPATVYGGPIVSTYHTYLELARRGIDVFVSTTNANGDTRLDVSSQQFSQLHKRLFVKYYDDTIIGRFSWRYVLFVWRDMRRCDLVRFEDIFSTYIPPSLLYARLLRKPTLISARGVLSDWSLNSKRRRAKKLWLAILVRPFVRSAWWHATSERERSEILQFDPDARVFVIPNGIDSSLLEHRPALSRREYMSHFAGVEATPASIIVSMGRLHRVKGFDVLIDAFARLKARQGDMVLLIAGKDDGERRRLDERVARLGLADSVFFTGELNGSEKLEFLSGGDVFALPSHNENFGNVYLEALATGVPVVASNVTPWRDVESAGCGKWVENTAEATENAIRELLAIDRKALRQCARAYARRFGWDAVARDFEECFTQMLNARRESR